MVSKTTKDFYAKVMKAIRENKIDQAVELILNLDMRLSQIDILIRLLSELGFAYNYEPKLDPFRTRYPIIERAHALARALEDALVRIRVYDSDSNRTTQFEDTFDNDIVLIHALDLARRLTDYVGIFASSSRNENGKRVIELIIRVLNDLKNFNSIDPTIDNLLGKHTITIVGVDTLTPFELSFYVAPYLQALTDLQQLIDQLTEVSSAIPRIFRISQNSPLEADLGGASQAITTIRDIVVPWRRENAKKMADLEIEKRQIEIESLQIANKTAEAQAAQQTLEAEKLKLEIERMRLENDEKRLNLEQKRLELHEAKIQMALTIIDRFMPNMPETKRISFVNQFIKALTVLVESPLSIE